MKKVEVQFSEKELDMLKVFISTLIRNKQARFDFRMNREETLDLSNKIGYLLSEARQDKNIYATSYFRKLKAN